MNEQRFGFLGNDSRPNYGCCRHERTGRYRRRDSSL
jgi:hypothetical protein